MTLSGKAADKIIFAVLYAGIAAITFWGGVRIINYSLESKFYQNFLLKWEVSIRAFSSEKVVWPHFTGGNHVEYMGDLVSKMRSKNIFPPASNTIHPYIYRINKVFFQNKENIFILCLPGRIIIYGVSIKTFKRLDSYVDGIFDPGRGRLTGIFSKDGKTYIGQWRL